MARFNRGRQTTRGFEEAVLGEGVPAGAEAARPSWLCWWPHRGSGSEGDPLEMEELPELASTRASGTDLVLIVMGARGAHYFRETL